jgi:hypothetical protein
VTTAESYASTAANTAQTNAISAAEAYALPLAGGTLTGGLAGTTGSFSSTLSAATVNSTNPYQIGGGNVLSVAGTNNLFVGSGAGASNTGANNAASGYQALASNTTGQANTATGDQALTLNTTGGGNVATGATALTGNTTGIANVATGTGALYYNNTNYNIAIGYQALYNNGYSGTGNNNTVVGANAGYNLGSTAPDYAGGSSNIILGYNAGSNFNSNESNNIDIGNLGGTGESGVIRIGGSNAVDGCFLPCQTATYIAGIYGAATSLSDAVPVLIDSNGNLGITSSSRRYKEDIRDMGAASVDLLRLRPVTFRYKKPYADGSKPIQYGLIAEEVADVYPDLVVRNKDGQIETVQYYKLDAMLLNEIQKLAKEHIADQAEIARLQSQVTGQAKQVQEQQAAMTQLLAQVHGIQLSLASGRPAHSGRHPRVARTAAHHPTNRAIKPATQPEVKHPSGQPLPSLVARVRF